MSRKVKFIKIESGFEVTRAWGEGGTGNMFNGCRVSVLGNEKVLKLDSYDGCTAP